MKFALNKTKMR